MTFVNHSQAGPVDPALVPQVIASYAAYLHTRTHLAPETTVTGENAQLIVSVDDKTLMLALDLRSRAWSLRSAELRRDQDIATFTRRRPSRRGRRVTAAMTEPPTGVTVTSQETEPTNTTAKRTAPANGPLPARVPGPCRPALGLATPTRRRGSVPLADALAGTQLFV